MTFSRFATGRSRLIAGFALMLIISAGALFLRPSLGATLAALPGRVSDIPPRLLALAAMLKAAQSLLSALAWRNVLRYTYPEQPPTYRLVFGLDQGKEAINVISPAKIGTWVMLGALRAAIPGAQMPGLISAWGAQSLAYIAFALINSVLIGLTLPSVVGAHPSVSLRQLGIVAHHPAMSVALALAAILLAALLTRRFWPRLIRIKTDLFAGAAILHDPGYYLVAVFLPSLLAYLCRIAIFGVIMMSFGIKLTIFTLILALAAHAVAGVIRFTPAGFGTTQAIDLLVLHTVASATAITAYSLTEGLMMTTFSLLFGVVALLWAFGWTQAKELAMGRASV